MSKGNSLTFFLLSWFGHECSGTSNALRNGRYNCSGMDALIEGARDHGRYHRSGMDA